MKTSSKLFVMACIIISNLVISCTPTDTNPTSNVKNDVVATGDDSSVRPDNDKDD